MSLSLRPSRFPHIPRRIAQPIRDSGRVESQHAHTEPFEDLRGDAPDLSGADDADGFAVEIESHQAVEREVELAHPVEGAVSFPIEREDERNGVLGHGVGRVARDPRDGDAQSLAASRSTLLNPAQRSATIRTPCRTRLSRVERRTSSFTTHRPLSFPRLRKRCRPPAGNHETANLFPPRPRRWSE